MRFAGLIATFIVLGVAAAGAQQVNDPDADTTVGHPFFPQDRGPVVAVDSGHNNFHTIEGRYEPFALLLRHDGFRVVDLKSPFTPESLAPLRVLVISNALPDALTKNFKAPALSAFSSAEIEAVKQWVTNGGSLLLIADHQPFAGSARDLAASFGFKLHDGVVERDPVNDGAADIFTRADGTLKDDPVTRGRDASETVTFVRTFTGSAFEAPSAARPIIVFPPSYRIHQCGLPCPESVAETPAGGMLQGAVMDFGKGRVAMFGEAAMFSAQIAMQFHPPFRAGFNAPDARENKQFILNLMHWLAGNLGG